MLVIWNNTKSWWQLICTGQEPITFFYCDDEGFRVAAVQSAFQQWWFSCRGCSGCSSTTHCPSLLRKKNTWVRPNRTCGNCLYPVVCVMSKAEKGLTEVLAVTLFSPVGSGSPRHGRMDRQQLVLPGLFTINQSAKTLNMYFANLVNSLSSIYILKWKCVESVAGSNARVEKQTNNGFRECKVNC